MRDFELTDAEMAEIAGLDTGKSVFFDHDAPETVERFVGLLSDRRGML